MAEIEYRVKKTFLYGAQSLKPGDVWEPAGGKFDEQIKRTLVRAVETKPKTAQFELKVVEPVTTTKTKEVIRE